MKLRPRQVKPVFFQHRQLFDLEQGTGLPLRIAYEGLWVAADRQGVFPWKPDELKLAIIPWDGASMEEVLATFLEHRFVSTFWHNHRQYGVVPTMAEHQPFNNREKPEYPNPALANGLGSPRIVEVDPTQVALDLGLLDQPGATSMAPRRATKGPKVPKPAPPSWTFLACKAWEDRYGHVANGGRITKLLKPLITKIGEEKVLEVWARYLKEKDPEFASPADFVNKWAVWASNGRRTTRKGAPEKFTYTPSKTPPKERE